VRKGEIFAENDPENNVSVAGRPSSVQSALSMMMVQCVCRARFSITYRLRSTLQKTESKTLSSADSHFPLVAKIGSEPDSLSAFSGHHRRARPAQKRAPRDQVQVSLFHHQPLLSGRREPSAAAAGRGARARQERGAEERERAGRRFEG
jgi:hypothetical protein